MFIAAVLLISCLAGFGSTASENAEEKSASETAVEDADINVPYLQSVHFAEDLGDIIGEENVQFSIIEGAPHEDDAFYTDENLADVYAFLDGTLK